MRLPVLAVVAVVLAAGLAGCFGASNGPVRVVPYLPLQDAEPGRPTEVAFLVESRSPFKQNARVEARLPPGWTFEPEVEEIEVLGGRTTSLIVRFTPDANASFGPASVGVVVAGVEARAIVNVRELGDEHLRAGIGTQLRYTLWLDNGTLVATNDPSVRDHAGLVWMGGAPDANGTYEPLKVYVGGKRGTPPPEPYNSTGCDTPPCYHPVIPGFDARLRDAGDGRGMVAGETLAVRVPKEQAYTYAGNEDHVLYGENLNFLITIVSVDEFHVRDCGLPVCPP